MQVALRSGVDGVLVPGPGEVDVVKDGRPVGRPGAAGPIGVDGDGSAAGLLDPPVTLHAPRPALVVRVVPEDRTL